MDLEFFRRRLVELQENLIQRYRDVASQTGNSAEERPSDIIDLASDSFDDDLAAALSEREAMELASIRNALQRIEQGKYGKCEECAKDISPERLEARPLATLCLKCQRELEKLGY
ncbi:MAG: TraR/DksA family transcriptional regulator [Planctomycetota bacterium]